MRAAAFALATLTLIGCRGENVPRDYQNSPPAVSHPIDKKSQSPSEQSTNTADPEPSYGAEGTSAPNQPTGPSAAAAPTQTQPAVRPDLPPHAIVAPPKK